MLKSMEGDIRRMKEIRQFLVWIRGVAAIAIACLLLIICVK